MTDLDKLKHAINDLYLTDPDIHMNVSITQRPKVQLENQAARIVGVYPNIFIIEADGKQYTLKYLDLFTGNIRILELGEDPFLSNKAKLSKNNGSHRSSDTI